MVNEVNSTVINVGWCVRAGAVRVSKFHLNRLEPVRVANQKIEISFYLDLKAFERRLTEYIHCLQPATGRWRMLLIVVSVCTATGAWNWLIDPETQKVSFFTSLWNHPFFTISCITLIGLFFAGIHKRVVAPSIIAARCRTVLAEYNMSCDDTGKLILKPRPHVQ